MATVGELVINLRGNNAQLSSTLDDSGRKVRRFANDGAQGMRKVENAVVDLGLQVVGLDGKWARLAEGALLFGAGGAVTLALTGGLLLIGSAMSESSKKAKEQADQLEKLGKKYHDLAQEVRLGARGLIEADLAKARSALASAPTSAPGLDQMASQSPLEYLKERFKHFWESRPGGSAQGKSFTAFLTGELKNQRAELEQTVKDIETVLADFDRKMREREEKRLNLPKSVHNSPLFEATRKAAEDRLKVLRDIQDNVFNTATRPARIIADAENLAKTITVSVDPAITNLAHKVQLWRDVTEQAIEASSAAFERFFFGLQSRGLSSFRNFVHDILQLWQQTVARIAADQLGRAIGLNALLGGITGGLSGLGGDGVLPGPTPPPGIGGGITLNVNVQAFDARGAKEAMQAVTPQIARGVLQAIRTNSEYAAAVRGG